MLTARQFSNSFYSNGDKRSNGHAPAHEYAVSRPDADRHSRTCSYSDECAHHHGYAHEFAHPDFDAVGHGYTRPDGHTDPYEPAHAVTDTNQH